MALKWDRSGIISVWLRHGSGSQPAPEITWQISNKNKYLVSLLCSQPELNHFSWTHSVYLFPVHFGILRNLTPFLVHTFIPQT